MKNIKKDSKQMLFEMMYKVGGMPLRENTNNIIYGIDNLNSLLNNNKDIDFKFTPDDRKYINIDKITNDGIIGNDGKLYKWYYIIRSGSRGDRKILISYGNNNYFYFEPQIPNDDKNYWETQADMQDYEKDIEDSLM